MPTAIENVNESDKLLELLSFRDRVAIAIMPAIYGRVMSGGFERVAKLSYEMADEMIKIRNLPKTS